MLNPGRALRGALLALLLVASLPAAQATPVPAVRERPVATPTRILFVGNSYLYYNDSLHNHVNRLVAAADPATGKALQYKLAAIGGAPLAHHDVKGLLAPGRLGLKEPFELVILQGHSAAGMSDARRASFREKVIEFQGEIAKTGARTVLYLTHAYVAPNKGARPDMLEKTADLYISVANEVGAYVIPVGLAFAEAYRLRPELRLHKDYDGSHPNLEGTYLAACVVYASLYGRSPVGNAYDYFGKVDKSTAAFLQKVAHDTVRSFLGQP